MTGRGDPDIPEWAFLLARAGDRLVDLADRLVDRFRCGHHWHPHLPPGGGAITDSTYVCCACPARRKRRPASPGRRECTRY